MLSGSLFKSFFYLAFEGTEIFEIRCLKAVIVASVKVRAFFWMRLAEALFF